MHSEAIQDRSGLLISVPSGPFCILSHGLLSVSAISVDSTLFFVEHVYSPVFNSFQLTVGHRVSSSQKHIITIETEILHGIIYFSKVHFSSS